jgi:hypothetical protein
MWRTISQKMGRKIALSLILGVTLIAPASLYAMRAVPSRSQAAAPSTKLASNSAFIPVCKAAEVVDTRPDPAWVGASFAHDNCTAPQMPALMDGYSATREQIVAGMETTKNYMARADAYQKCVSDFITASRAEARTRDKPVNVNLITIENHRIAASQANKKKADILIKVAINAFNELGSECPD